MNLLLTAAALAAVAIGSALALAPRDEIVTEVAIDAAPERVWQVLTDGAAYPEWNPFMRAMKGEIATGAVLENTMQPAPDKTMVFRPTVLHAHPSRELRWLGRFLAPRVFDGEHYFLLEPAKGGTRLVHGEKFRGVALWFMDVQPFARNFEAMNMALKARAERG